MQKSLYLILITASIVLDLPLVMHAQPDSAARFGFRHIRLPYKGDTVEILIKSKKGE